MIIVITQLAGFWKKTIMLQCIWAFKNHFHSNFYGCIRISFFQTLFLYFFVVAMRLHILKHMKWPWALFRSQTTRTLKNLLVFNVRDLTAKKYWNSIVSMVYVTFPFLFFLFSKIQLLCREVLFLFMDRFAWACIYAHINWFIFELVWSK